jgi:hypothetical protein
MFLRGIPFAVVYRQEVDESVIVALAHRRRAPGFWHGRAK